MGAGIAQVAATAGEEVTVFDTNSASIDRASVSLNKIMDRLVEKERVSREEADEILGRITFVDSLHYLENSELVIEAIIENLEVKQTVFSQLEELVSESCIIASNTSSLSIASISSAVGGSISSSTSGGSYFQSERLFKALVGSSFLGAVASSTKGKSHFFASLISCSLKLLLPVIYLPRLYWS